MKLEKLFNTLISRTSIRNYAKLGCILEICNYSYIITRSSVSLYRSSLVHCWLNVVSYSLKRSHNKEICRPRMTDYTYVMMNCLPVFYLIKSAAVSIWVRMTVHLVNFSYRQKQVC